MIGAMVDRDVRDPTRPVVAELVGPAAAGKTSLLRLLSERDPSLLAGVRPSVGAHLVSAAALLPTFLRLQRSSREWLLNEMKRLTYLRSLHRTLARANGQGDSAIVLDEGPVYMLARLGVYGGGRVEAPGFGHWWRGAFDQWARTLDLIVCLDAPDAVLISRLRTRRQRHRLQTVPDAVIESFLESYRGEYARVISALRSAAPVRVLEFRTDREPPAGMADRILSALRDERGAGP